MIDEIDSRYFLQTSPQKDIGYVQANDIVKSCDVCGEGRSYGRKKRLHLYMKSTYDNAAVACFNCGYKGNMFSYLKDYHPREFELYKKEKQSSSFNSLQDELVLPDPIVTQEPKICTDFMKTEPSPVLMPEMTCFSEIPNEALEYLKSRGITALPEWKYTKAGNKFIFNDKEVNLNDYIIVPLKKGNKWYGFQAIGWKYKKFFVYLLQGNEGWKIWNWFNINKDEPVYIFESIFDCVSGGLDNSIAQIGVSIHEDRLHELKTPVFCMDNQRVDDTSLKESLKYAEAGYSIFIWPEGTDKFKDTNDLVKAGASKLKISELIKKNIYKGVDAVLKLKLI
jgi:hypothetical protein